MRLLLLSLLSVACIHANNFYYEYGQKVELTELSNPRTANNNIAYYQKSNGKQVGVKKNEILLKCNEGIACLSILDAYNFASVKALSRSIYLITLQETQNIFTYSQTLHNNAAIEFAHPNFVKERKRR